VRVVTLIRSSGEGNVARMGKSRGLHSVLVGKPEERDLLGAQELDGRIILRWIFRTLELLLGLDELAQYAAGGWHLWFRCGILFSINSGNILSSCKV
jgi:hypothetical protein